MFNLFDMLQAQSGQSMQALGQQFGLSPEQSRRAVEALLPALSIGLQRNAADPAGFHRLFGLAGPQASDPFRLGQPDLLLGQLFGSQALSQAVLQQAAAASGIGTQALRQILPLMAGMVVAGIVHMMLNQPQQPAQPAPPPRTAPEPATFPAANFWKDWMDNFLTAANGPTPDRTREPEARPSPIGRSELPPPQGAQPAEPAAEARDVPLEVLQQMFQTGAQVQEQNVKAMQNLFDTFWQRQQDAGPRAAQPGEQAPQPTRPVVQAEDTNPDKPRKTRTKPIDQTK